MAYTLENIGQYGFAPIGNLQDMIVEAIKQLLAVGKDRYEIADILGISYKTVEVYARENGVRIPRVPNQYGYGKLINKTVDDFLSLQNTHKICEIAELWDVSEPTLKRWREENGLTFRKRKAARYEVKK